jgi:hypothetical protein
MDSIKGVKEMEILINYKVVWYGVIKRGTGNDKFAEKDDYVTTI